MTVCNFFLKGNCKFGTKCKNEHTVNRIFLDEKLLELDWKKERPQWPYSSYATGKFEPNLLLGLDLSQEEVRLQAYNAVKSGSLEHHSRILKALDGSVATEMDRIFKLKGYIDINSVKNAGFENSLNNTNFMRAPISALGNSTASGFGSMMSSGYGTMGPAEFGTLQHSSALVTAGASVQQNTGTFGGVGYGSQSPQNNNSSSVFKSSSFGSSGFATASNQPQASVFGKSKVGSFPGQTASFSSTPFGTTGNPHQSSAFGSSSFGMASGSGPTGFGRISGQQESSSFGSVSTHPTTSTFGSLAQPQTVFGSSVSHNSSSLSFGTSNPSATSNNVFGNQRGDGIPASTSSSSLGHDSKPFPASIPAPALTSSLTTASLTSQLNATTSINTPSAANSTSLSTNSNIDPISEFRAQKFRYGKIPEIEPPEGLR